MDVESLEAYVIHKRWSGDTSADLTFFTREHGVFTALYKGGRTPKKQALIQEFTPLWLVLNRSRQRFYVASTEMKSPPVILTRQQLFSGLYLNELLHHSLRFNDPHPELYDAYAATLNALSTADNQMILEKILRQFEWCFLSACGLQMSLTEDLNGDPIRSEGHYQLNPGDGFIQAELGIIGEHILAFHENKLDDPSVLKSAKWIMRRAIDHALDGKPIKARGLWSTT